MPNIIIGGADVFNTGFFGEIEGFVRRFDSESEDDPDAEDLELADANNPTGTNNTFVFSGLERGLQSGANAQFNSFFVQGLPKGFQAQNGFRDNTFVQVGLEAYN
jgi:hypothetical protein